MVQKNKIIIIKNLIIIKLIRLLLKIFKINIDWASMKLFKDNYNENYFKKSLYIKNNELTYYSSNVPDRYSENIHIYNQQTNFLDFSDLNKWLTGNHQSNIGDLNRFFFINLCIDSLIEEKIIGNVAEVGVYKGNSAFLLSKYAKLVNSKCYLFDTYNGFDNKDIVGFDANQTNLFTDTSLEYVKNVIGENKNVVFIKGYFPESLDEVGEIDSFSLVHIDCDLEKPITESLKYFYPRLKKGGFLIMHDYSSLYWKGSKIAIDTFFMDKKEMIVPIADKSGSCVIRKI